MYQVLLFLILVLLFHVYRYGFGAYFNILPGSEWSALMLTYGFPLAIIGMALKVKKFLDQIHYINIVQNNHVGNSLPNVHAVASWFLASVLLLWIWHFLYS